MRRVLVDYHHRDLFHSLVRLFERRMGWEVYRPIGMDWYQRGYWRVGAPYGFPPATTHQYLALGCQEHTDADALYGCVNASWGRAPNGLGFLVKDPTHDVDERAITWAQFMSTPFDLVISSITEHDGPFARLCAEHMSKPRHIAQMGNIGQATDVRHVMHNAPYTPKPGQNAIHYHQEIDTDLFSYEPPPDRAYGYPPRIASCVNLLPHPGFYLAYKASMPDVEFRAYGASCPDGSLRGAKEIAPMMRKQNMGWHIKPLDGFGHTAMGWLYTGRPVVTRMREIAEYGMDAPRMFIDGETCIAIDGLSVEEGVQKIRRALEPEENLRMSAATARRFRELVNYDEEADNLRTFIEGVLS